MYLFTRRTRLAEGNGTAGLEWATAVAEKAIAITGQELQLWATVFSPASGTIAWTSWFHDLASLEKVGDALDADASMTKLLDEGAPYAIGGFDDAVLHTIYGAPDRAREIEYAGSVAAVASAGHIEQAMGAGIAIARAVHAVTGLPCLFAQTLAGPCGGVGWLTAYDNASAIETATNATAAEPTFLALVDSTAGYFVEDPAMTRQTFYRRLA